MGKTALYLIYFGLYSVVLLIIGKGSLCETYSPRDYFICERKVNLPFSVATFTGTWVSAITILSLTGSVYEDGLAVLFYSVIPWFLGAFLLGMVTRRLYDNDIITAPEIFRTRYGSQALQAIYGLIFAAVYVFYLVSQFKGFGMVAAALFDIPYSAAVGLVYLFIMYTTFGGYRSVVRSDMFNLILLMVSLAVVFFAIIHQVGGLGSLYTQLAQLSSHNSASNKESLLTLFGGRYTPLVSLSMFWGWGLGLAANPQYIVRLLGARDPGTARNTVLCSLGLLAIIYFALIHIGLGMRVLVPELPSAQPTDGIIIYLINNDLYGPWSGFFLYSVIGACVSTANSHLLLIASSFAYDVAGNLWGSRLSERRIVSLGQLAVLLGGTLAMVLALHPPAFTLSYGGDLWGSISILFFPPLYGTLLTNRITRRGIWACLATGMAAIAVLYPMYYSGALTAHPAMYGVMLSSAAMFLVSAWDRRRKGARL